MGISMERARVPRGIGPLAFPPIIGLLLALPCFGFTYLFDDYDFLARARHFSLAQLLPDPGSTFYRPLSREAYFAFLTLLGGASPLWGHLLNAACVALVILLVALFATRIAGPRVGFFAGLFLALLGPMPVLIGWVSGVQDVLAMLLFMVAMHCRLAGRSWSALGFCAAALLAKETVVTLLPIVAALPWILGGGARRPWKRDLVPYGALALIWTVAHPKVRDLLLHGLASGPGAYLGLDNTSRGGNIAGMASALVNVPSSTGALRPIPGMNLILPVALAVLFLSLWISGRNRRARSRGRYSCRRVVILGVLMAALPAFATALFVKHWAPYYACIPAMGVSILAALAMARLDHRVAAVVLTIFLGLGVLSRESEEGGPFRESEATFASASADVERVEHGMKALRPDLPAGARIYVSVHLPMERWVHAHLLHYQAPRAWYGRSGIQVRPAGLFDPSDGPSVIFWVSPTCRVFEMEYPSLHVRSSGPPATYEDYQQARRLVALGLFRAGQVDRAAAAIAGMGEPDAETRAFDRRFAAALYLTAGKTNEATEILRNLPPVGRTEAMASLAAILGPVGSREDFEPHAFLAYGIPLRDSETWRCLMRWFVSQSQMEPALRMARHLLALRPADAEANQVAERISEIPAPEPVTVAQK